jgi:aminoglycoside/choline kinase family phosphotransferase
MDEAQARSNDEAELVAAVSEAVEEVLGVPAERVTLLPGQLGLRRFARVALGGGPVARLVARIEAAEDPAGRPAGVPPEPPLEPIRALLEAHGVPVPRRYGTGGRGRIELLEDLGDVDLGAAVADAPASERRALYEQACDLVPRLQRIGDPGGVEAFGRRLDSAHFAYKADLFAAWSLAERGRPATRAETACVRDAFAAIGRLAAEAPARLAHRDLQSANLHVVGGDRLVLIDLQGALLAPPEYDLVCLLRDSYVTLPEEEITRLLERVRPSLPDAPDADTTARRFDLLTLTRKGKDHARFVYAARARGDSRFLAHVPATLHHLRTASRRAAARDPRFADLAELIHALPERPCAP